MSQQNEGEPEDSSSPNKISSLISKFSVTVPLNDSTNPSTPSANRIKRAVSHFSSPSNASSSASPKAPITSTTSVSARAAAFLKSPTTTSTPQTQTPPPQQQKPFSFLRALPPGSIEKPTVVVNSTPQQTSPTQAQPFASVGASIRERSKSLFAPKPSPTSSPISPSSSSNSLVKLRQKMLAVKNEKAVQLFETKAGVVVNPDALLKSIQAGALDSMGIATKVSDISQYDLNLAQFLLYYDFKLLLEFVQMNPQIIRNSKLIHLATYFGMVGSVNRLIEVLLAVPSSQGSDEVAKVLNFSSEATAGGNSSAQTSILHQILHEDLFHDRLALSFATTTSIFDLLAKQHSADVNQANPKNGKTVIMYITASCNTSLLLHVLENYQVSCSKLDNSGVSVFQICLGNANIGDSEKVDMLKLLFKHGKDITSSLLVNDRVRFNQDSLLHSVCRNIKPQFATKVLETLMEQVQLEIAEEQRSTVLSSWIDSVNSENATCLHVAASHLASVITPENWSFVQSCMELLLKYSSESTLQRLDNSNENFAMVAARLGQFELVRYLFSHDKCRHPLSTQDQLRAVSKQAGTNLLGVLSSAQSETGAVHSLIDQIAILCMDICNKKQNILHYICSDRQHSESTKKLIDSFDAQIREKGETWKDYLEQKDEKGNVPLVYCLTLRKLDLLADLLAKLQDDQQRREYILSNVEAMLVPLVQKQDKELLTALLRLNAIELANAQQLLMQQYQLSLVSVIFNSYDKELLVAALNQDTELVKRAILDHLEALIYNSYRSIYLIQFIVEKGDVFPELLHSKAFWDAIQENSTTSVWKAIYHRLPPTPQVAEFSLQTTCKLVSSTSSESQSSLRRYLSELVEAGKHHDFMTTMIMEGYIDIEIENDQVIRPKGLLGFFASTLNAEVYKFAFSLEFLKYSNVQTAEQSLRIQQHHPLVQQMKAAALLAVQSTHAKEELGIWLFENQIIDMSTPFGGTLLLHFLVASNNMDLAETLLSQDSNAANLRDEEGRTPIFFAKSTDMVTLLVYYGADVNVLANDGSNCLHPRSALLSPGSDLSVLRVLLHLGADLYHRNNDAISPFSQCQRSISIYGHGNMSALANLVNYGTGASGSSNSTLEFYHRRVEEEEQISIHLSRKNIVRDLIQVFKSHSNYELLRKAFRVTFDGEAGIDAGGVTSDMYTTFFAELVQVGMFPRESTSSFYVLPARDDKKLDVSDFEAIGKIMYKASIIDTRCISIQLPYYFFHFLMQTSEKEPPTTPLTLAELFQVDPDMASNFQKFLQMDIAEDSELFEWENLDESASDNVVYVTNKNKHEYVQQRIYNILLTSRLKNMTAIREGFRQLDANLGILAPGNNASSTTTSTGGSSSNASTKPATPANYAVFLKNLVCGEEKITGEMVTQLLRFEEFDTKSPTPEMLVACIKSLDDIGLRKLLSFITGIASLIVQNTRCITVRCSQQHQTDAVNMPLPLGKTCFSMLMLPDYQDEAVLKKKLLYAIGETEGLGLA